MLQLCHTWRNISPPVYQMYNHEVCTYYTQIRQVFCGQCKIQFILGMYTGTLRCIVKLPDEVWVRHTKQVGDNETILQLKKFAEVLLTGLFF